MLETLSQLQLDLIARKRDEWIALGLSTASESEVVAARPAAEKALDECYEQAALAAPKKLWARSPLEAVKMDFEACRELAARGAQDKSEALAQVRDQVWVPVRDQVSSQVRDQVWTQVIDQVSSQVRDQVRDQVWVPVRDQVRDQVESEVLAQSELRSHINKVEWFYGNQETWLSFYDTFDELDVPGLEKIRPLVALAKASGWGILRKGFAIMCDKPVELRLDGQDRLHNLDGPACRFGDGFAVHALAGKRMPRDLIETPWLFSVASAFEQGLMDELGMSMVNKLGKLDDSDTWCNA